MEIIPRSAWAPRYEAGYGPRPIGNLERYLHHTVTKHLSEDASFEEEAAQMRAIEAIGEERFGFGISYTLLFFPSGRAWEGAGIGRISAHSGPGRNTRGAGLSLAGNYELHPFGALVHNSVVNTLRYGVEQGWWTAPTITEAHRQFKSTSCPGKHAFAAIPSINAAALRGVAPSRDDSRPPLTWRPAVKPELINERLHLMGIRTAGRLSDYDRAAVHLYQSEQLFPDLVDDGLWGPVTEAHYNWTVALQQALERVGGELAADGFYGPQTRITVLNFQKAVGLPATGLADAATCKVLGVPAHP